MTLSWDMESFPLTSVYNCTPSNSRLTIPKALLPITQ